MKNKKLLIISICLILLLSTTLTGCTIVNKSMVKLGIINKDFDYMVNNKVDKIIIQNSRDTGFRFVVTDKGAINDIYSLLRKGKVRKTKTSLDPDYIFEIHMVGDKIKYYKYVVSSNEKGTGNFYDKNKAYEISNNLDETILNNLEFIRKPKDFNDIYFNSIIQVLKLNKKGLSSKDNKVGIDINGDVDCLKYIFSIDLENFKKNIKKVVPNASLIKKSSDDFNTVITVDNDGYSTKLFKTVIIIDNRKNKSYETYYVKGTYEYRNWDIVISKPNEKPSDW